MRQVVYISGSGRSGSTLLERLIHAADDTCSLGELHVLWRLASDTINCSCGEAFGSCDHWRAIMNRCGFKGEIGELRLLENTVCKSWFCFRRGCDPKRIGDDSGVRRFLQLQRQLFGAIHDETRNNIIVDSSKAGPRAMLLACMDEVRFAHLWRDPVDVIRSWRSNKFDRGTGSLMPKLSVARATWDWMKSEYFIRRVAAVRPVFFLSYHGFCDAPQESFERLSEQLGLSRDGIAWRSDLRTFQPKGDYHSLNGNPDRFATDAITIRAKKAKLGEIPSLDKISSRLFGAVAKNIYPEPGRASG